MLLARICIALAFLLLLTIFRTQVKYWITKLDDVAFSGLLWATSTRQAFRILTLIIIIASIIQPPTNLYQWLVLIVSVFYQGVALPGLGYHSKLSEAAAEREGQASRKLLQDTHDIVVGNQTQMLDKLNTMMTHVESIVVTLKDEEDKLCQEVELEEEQILKLGGPK